MKLCSFIIIMFFTVGAWAQNVSVKDIPADEKDTTIHIHKGEKKTHECEPQYEVVTSEDEIGGDGDILKTKAKDSWKVACENWKNEIKNLNKENRILFLSCGSPNCGREDNSYICKSKGTFKARVKLKD